MTSRGTERLDEDACLALLASKDLGRIVVKIADHVAALPVWYTVVGRSVAFLTDPGTKLDAALLRTRVSFEVDDADAAWSVIVVGHAHPFTDREQAEEARHALLKRWPQGSREHLVQIDIEQITGRRLRATPS